MASNHLEIHRTPMEAARAALSMAAGDRVGLATRLAAGLPVSRETIRAVLAKWTHALHEFDRVTMAAIEAESINGRQLCTNDPDDMSTALITALERIEERPCADPNAGLALGPADCLPRVGSFW